MFLCVYSEIDHRQIRNTVRTSVTHSSSRRVPLFWSYHMIMSDAIAYWTDAKRALSAKNQCDTAKLRKGRQVSLHDILTWFTDNASLVSLSSISWEENLQCCPLLVAVAMKLQEDECALQISGVSKYRKLLSAKVTSWNLKHESRCFSAKFSTFLNIAKPVEWNIMKMWTVIVASILAIVIYPKNRWIHDRELFWLTL